MLINFNHSPYQRYIHGHKNVRHGGSQGLPAVVVDGNAAKQRKKANDNWTTGALIISYECLRETQKTIKNEYGEIQEVSVSGD